VVSISLPCTIQSTHASCSLVSGDRGSRMNFNDPRYIFPFFLMVWIGAGVVVAKISGWGELSRCYRSGSPFDGRRWRFRNGRMRLAMGYNNCLAIGSSPQGLYLAVLFIFRVGHPPLFVPWQDISVKMGKTLWWRWTEFRFRQAPRVHLKIKGSLGDEIKSAAGKSWPGENVLA
jgi:hypothetical protein